MGAAVGARAVGCGERRAWSIWLGTPPRLSALMPPLSSVLAGAFIGARRLLLKPMISSFRGCLGLLDLGARAREQLCLHTFRSDGRARSRARAAGRSHIACVVRTASHQRAPARFPLGTTRDQSASHATFATQHDAQRAARGPQRIIRAAPGPGALTSGCLSARPLPLREWRHKHTHTHTHIPKICCLSRNSRPRAPSPLTPRPRAPQAAPRATRNGASAAGSPPRAAPTRRPPGSAARRRAPA